MMDSPDSRSEERTGPSEVAGSTGTTSPASGVDTPGGGSEGARIRAASSDKGVEREGFADELTALATALTASDQRVKELEEENEQLRRSLEQIRDAKPRSERSEDGMRISVQPNYRGMAADALNPAIESMRVRASTLRGSSDG